MFPFLLVSGTHHSGFPSPDYSVDQYLIYVIKSEEGKEEHVSNIVTKEGPRGKKEVFKKMP